MSFEQQLQVLIEETVERMIPKIVEKLGGVSPKPTMTVEETMEVLGVSKNRMYELLQLDNFPAIKPGKRWVILTDGLHQWMKEDARKVL
ncbi:helix-turn-helix domain-containing protein [Ectobacillus antri]|uniref:helix-turn-helix domain-containing protein n=1 Tax=Ectobacillus antri TaxID=2486280 RepID=UPI000F5917E3|nr:helix-turn-helix domain-containing protein [Ectobacillus antri]